MRITWASFKFSAQQTTWLLTNVSRSKNIFEDSSQKAKCYNTHVAGKRCCLEIGAPSQERQLGLFRGTKSNCRDLLKEEIELKKSPDNFFLLATNLHLILEKFNFLNKLEN